MQALIAAFVRIALRQAGPDCLPASGFLVLVVGASYALLQLITGWVDYGIHPRLGLVIVVDLALLAAFAWAVLRVGGKTSRFPQTLTALFGTGILLSLINLPFSLWRAGSVPGEQLPAITVAVGLALVIWSVIIGGHIYARALSQTYAVGLLIAVLHLFVNLFVVIPILPDVT